MCLLAICISSLKKCLFRSSTHFFDWVVCFYIELHKLFVYLEINPLSVASFQNLFGGLSFCLVYGFLCCTKLLSLIRSHLFILANLGAEILWYHTPELPYHVNTIKRSG